MTLQQQVAKLKAENLKLKEEVDDFWTLHRIQHRRLQYADKLWQKAHNKPNVLPDLGELIDWLIERATIVGNDITSRRERRLKERLVNWQKLARVQNRDIRAYAARVKRLEKKIEAMKKPRPVVEGRLCFTEDQP